MLVSHVPWLLLWSSKVSSSTSFLKNYLFKRKRAENSENLFHQNSCRITCGKSLNVIFLYLTLSSSFLHSCWSLVFVVALLMLTPVISPNESGFQGRYFKFTCQLASGLVLLLEHLGSSGWGFQLKTLEMAFVRLEPGPALPEEINTSLWEMLLSGKMSNLSDIL